MVTAMLFFFRLVYSEVVTALPVNGGTYNLILNTTTKKTAGIVACLSVLSYIATAIVSAFDAIIYLTLLWPEAGDIVSIDCLLSSYPFSDIRSLTVAIIVIFALIALCGVKESSTVSFILFAVHITILILLVIWSLAYAIKDEFSIFHENINSPIPDIFSSDGTLLSKGNVPGALFFGYCSALLGITGFESAANYVEEMESPAVFVSTVNWLW